MDKERLLVKTANGKSVFLDSYSSHALTHFKDVPLLERAVTEAIPKIVADRDVLRIEFEMNYVVGNSDLVEIDNINEITYALRPHRDRYSKFVKGKTPEPSNWIVLDLRLREDGNYSLYTAFIGRLTPSFPGGDFLSEQSVEFWSKHALVWGTQEVVEGTETSECPW